MSGEKSSVTSNGQAYLMEAAGTAGLIILAGCMSVWFEHPSLPVMRGTLSQHAVLRRVMFGILLGAYLAGVTQLFGKRSGAHLNPSVTGCFLTLGKIRPRTALLYIVMQYAGATTGALLLSWVLGKWFSHPIVNYALTEPWPPHGMLSAWIAEFVISFLMMTAVLWTASSQRREKWVPLVAGGCIALFIAIELPLSGMSLNPARSFAASFVANKWRHYWVYCTAPILGMVLAALFFLRVRRKHKISGEGAGEKSDAEDFKEISCYPVKQGAEAE